MKKIYSITLLLAVVLTAKGQESSSSSHHYDVLASQMKEGAFMTGCGTESERATYHIIERENVPFAQQAVSQRNAKGNMVTKKPYYRVRMALPIPSCYTPTEQGQHAGLDWGVYAHLHSGALEVLPNGDLLAIYFSTPIGKAEADTSTTFVQARRRYGSDEWDMPELFFATKGGNDQSALLFTDKDTVWFFGGGRDMTDQVPFRICRSTDNGVSWTFSVPQVKEPLKRYTAQPISNAFRNKRGEIFIALDGQGGESFLMKSEDNGVTWTDMGGRTSSRHSTIVPLDDKGTLLSAGGKNNSIDGWNPQNISHNWGETWEEGTKGFIPPLGTAQRPCMIRLKSGALCLVSDSYMHKKKIAPPKGWRMGNDCFAAISYDNGRTWTMRRLPIALPQHHRIQHPSLGYVTMRQGRDGMIHVLTTTNYPGLEIEFNEAWIMEGNHCALEADHNTPDCLDATVEGRLKELSPFTKSGTFVAEGTHTTRYSNGKKQHEVTYLHGRRIGTETLWRNDGSILWQWKRDIKTNRGVWTQYWPNGKKRIESTWLLLAAPSHMPGIPLNGAIADGPSHHFDKDGNLQQTFIFHNGVEEGTENMGKGSGIKNEGQ